MYPLHYANLFVPFPRNHKVFVAMGFAPEFDHRWEKVIKPAVRRVAMDGVKLEAYRVDARIVGDSILTEILDGISNARVVLADVTTVHNHGAIPCRNSNVLYEVGIAHSLRLPEEVLLFRSDHDRLMFDLANVRVNQYDPDNDEEGARVKIAESLIDSLKELSLRRSAFVKRAADRLDGSCHDILLQAMRNGGKVVQPAFRNMRDALSNTRYLNALGRLLDLGVIQFENFKITKEMLDSLPDQIPYEYRLTPFGESVFHALLDRTGFNEPQVLEQLTRLFKQDTEQTIIGSE